MSMSPIGSAPTRPFKPLIIGGIVALVLVIGALLYHPKKPSPSGEVYEPVSTVLAAPDSYENFPATVTHAGNPLTVSLAHATSQGTVDPRIYTITIDDSTIVESLRVTGTGSSTRPLTPASIAVGNLVQVYANENVADVREFTATKIYRLDK